MPTELNLGFKFVECPCGASRGLTVACESCGRKPGVAEVDPDLDRRQKLAQAAEEHASTSVTVGEAEASAGGIMRTLLTAAELAEKLVDDAGRALVAGPSDATIRFCESVSMLRRLVPDLLWQTELRPLRALRPSVIAAGKEIEGFVDDLLAALASNTVAEADLRRKSANGRFIAAERAVEQALQITALWTTAENAEDPWTGLLVAAAKGSQSPLLSRSVDSMSNDVRRTAPEYPGVVNKDRLSVLPWIQSVLIFDQQSFSDIVAWAFRALTDNRGHFERIVGEPAWRERWSTLVSKSLLVGESYLHELSLNSPTMPELQSVRNFLRLCHGLQEDVVKDLLATVRFVVQGNETFERLLASGVANNVEWAQGNGLPGLELDAVPTRAAYAHSDWEYLGGVVRLCALKPPKVGTVTVSFRELLDHGFAIQEFAVAAVVAIDAAASILELQLPVPDGTDRVLEPLASAVLAAAGWNDVGWGHEGTSIQLTADASESADIVPLLDIAPLLGGQSLTCSVSTPSGVHCVALDLSLFREWNDEADDDTRAMLFARALHATTIDGRPVASVDAVRSVLAQKTSLVGAGDDHNRVVSTFKVARSIAQELGDGTLLSQLKTAQGWRLSRRRGFERPMSEIADYTSWASTEPSFDVAFADPSGE